MERKSLGSFLSTLRKANGMTQKELAQRLNVSDKSVSRWECDDGAPDLSVIPALAEIFGVTCDELLRGERLPPQQEPNHPPKQTQQQRRLLLRAQRTRYRNQTLTAAGLAAVGLIAAAICNLCLLRAKIGFLTETLFLLAALIGQGCFVNTALRGIPEEQPDAETDAFRREIARTAALLTGEVAALLGFALPLLLFSASAYTGMSGADWLKTGLLCAAAAVLLWAILLFLLWPVLIRRGIYPLTEAGEARFRRNRRRLRRYALLTAAVMTLTAAGQIILNEIDPLFLTSGQIFEDYDSFKAFMETDVPPQNDQFAAVASASSPDATDEEETLYDKSENAVCTYIRRNFSPVRIRYLAKSDDLLPIQVYTVSDIRTAERRIHAINALFGAAYAVQLLSAVLLYQKKRAA